MAPDTTSITLFLQWYILQILGDWCGPRLSKQYCWWVQCCCLAFFDKMVAHEGLWDRI